MTLLSARTQFVKMSGRYDLVVDDVAFADNGADFYINTGQRFLDRKQHEILKASGRNYQSVTVDSWYAILQNCRAIHEVWISNSTGEKWKLTKYDLKEIREEYPKDPANVDTGPPLFYAPVTLRVMPETGSQLTIDEFGATAYTEAFDHYGYTGIIYMPPADGTYKLEIHGLFYHPALSADADTNFWTEQEEYLLVLGALWALEVSYRNTAGADDWEAAIDKLLIGMGFDLADELSSEILQMEG